MFADKPSGALWSEERVERELRAWFGEQSFDRWPAYRTFAAHGRKRLHAQLVRNGGSAHWAARLGMEVVERPGGRLPDEDILPILQALIDEHDLTRFPTLAWLTAHGPHGLAQAVRRTGGGVRWARELGLKAQRVRWTDELIEAALRDLISELGHWPTKAEARAAGATGVMHAVYSGHGSRWWARRLGLPTRALLPRRGRGRTTDDDR